ncbi:hypothetical protein LTR70_007238 [Exophiala xenobiotica]|uniref:Sulfatase N-terminal domain-containing protein n=1 Tax=Lithohypha guttulata TaxID=1690604 RepID=A0ABR0K4S7_9EURO|nr:hypothetical protein LTR24_006822 [Lithohypha guttulata]KAK5314264.1 hypothetical protein LTR70_007238 [Exophiala xenobiotica]
MEAVMGMQHPLASVGDTYPSWALKSPGDEQPNIIFILTDDQDLHMSSLEYMPHLQEHLVRKGTTFTNHYCTVALCCPSRVSLWTGKHAHNTNVTDINPPHGGYPKFVSQGFNDDYFPLWMQDAGYDTYYVGKLFNAQSTSNFNKPYPRGWNGSDFLLDPYTYEYLNATMQRNEERWEVDAIHEEPRSYEGHYATDVLAEKSLSFLDEAITQRKGAGRPFFLTIAPTAPHSNVHINIDLSHGGGKYTETTAVQSPPVPAKRYEHLFQDVIVPRTPDFNPDQQKPVAWLKTLPKQNQTNVDSNDHWYRQRLRALQAVDEMIPPIIERLQGAGMLDETYIVFSSDNGYHIGQHRLQPGKQCAYETDINVPMVVRGPGIGHDESTDLVSSHVDLAPTFLQLAGIDVKEKGLQYGLDGASIPLLALSKISGVEDQGRESETPPEALRGTDTYPEQPYDKKNMKTKHGYFQEHVNVEMWGIIMSEGKYGQVLYPNHTYKALRVIAADGSYDLLYTVWCTNEHELYDLKHDPYALQNLHEGNDGSTAFDIDLSLNAQHEDKDQYVSIYVEDRAAEQGRNLTISPSMSNIQVQQLIHRLDALLMVLKTCKGRQCTHPWEQLHPTGDVSSLRDALAPHYDDFYEQEVVRVAFDQCEQAYVLESEGPMWEPGAADIDGKVRVWPEMLT